MRITFFIPLLGLFLPAALPAADSTLFRQGGAYFDREGDRIIIRKAQLAAMHAVSLGDALEKVPGLVFARNSFLGGLSDLTRPGREYYLDDKPVCLIVDGMEKRKVRADRAYLNDVSLRDIETIVIEPNRGGLGRGEVAVRIATADTHQTDARTGIQWENGPFEMNMLKFSFSRRLGVQTGLYVGTEKYYMFEDEGYFHAGPDRYGHPGPIVDIYSAFLQRPDSLYVDNGLKFEDDFRNWDVKINSCALPRVNLCAGFEFTKDFQDDYRPAPAAAGGSGYLNFGAWQRSEKFYLLGRSLLSGPLRVHGNVFSEQKRVRFADSARNADYRDTSVFMQGVNTVGGGAEAEYGKGPLLASLSVTEGLDEALGRKYSEKFRRDHFEASLSYTREHGNALSFRAVSALPADRDTTPECGNGFLLSPSIKFFAGLPGRAIWDGAYGCERRYPDYSLYYFDNPRLNYTAPGPSEIRRIKSYYSATGLSLFIRAINLQYRVSGQFTADPVAYLTVRDSNGVVNAWRFTQDSVAHESRFTHTGTLEFRSRRVVLHSSAVVTRFACRSDRFPRPFWTLALNNALTLQRRFMRDRLDGRVTLSSAYRPQVWAPDYYILQNSGFDHPLNAYLSFDLDMEFAIRTFTLYARLQNLTNQVVSYEPGYHLPGPLIRWGIEWNFGN